MKRRAEVVLATIKEEPPAVPILLEGDALRAARAIQVLERIGTAEARKILEQIAAGPITAAETAEAVAAVSRLERRNKR